MDNVKYEIIQRLFHYFLLCSDYELYFAHERIYYMKKTLAVLLSLIAAISSMILPVKADIIKGDVNGDGKITSLDSMIVQRAAVGLITLNENQKTAADCNNDNRVTNIDSLYILRYAVGIRVPAFDKPVIDETDVDTDTEEKPSEDDRDTDKPKTEGTDTDTKVQIETADEPEVIKDTNDKPDEVKDTADTPEEVTETNDKPDEKSETPDEPDSIKPDSTESDTEEPSPDESDTDEPYEEKPMLYLPEKITINCGDRTTLNPQVINGSDEGLTYYFEYDGAISYDGTGETVLEVSYASGLLKGYHPGTDHVVVTASNGLTAECDVTVVNNKTEKTIHVGDHTLKLTKEIMIYNDCYSESYDFYDLYGLVVHSTAEPGITADQWYSMWNNGKVDACVHAFLDDKGVYQYLPFEQRGWHAGYPVNNTRLSFEICEPAGFYYDENWEITDYDVEKQQAYFDKVWENATVFAAYLIYKYDIDEDNIISHYEANLLGIGTKHNDPDHWFILHDKTMDDFREDVWKLLDEDIYETDEIIICSLE